jgi:hypothetical protein
MASGSGQRWGLHACSVCRGSPLKDSDCAYTDFGIYHYSLSPDKLMLDFLVFEEKRKASIFPFGRR